MDRFIKCYEFIKKMEGGYNCVKGDTGGQTIFGIAQAFNSDLLVWDEILGQYGDEIDTALKMGNSITGNNPLARKITAWVAGRPDLMSEIKACYYHRYWIPSHAYQLPAPLDMIQMDAYFNMGVTANKILQNWCGVEQDGIIGKNTLKAVRDCKNPIPELFYLRWDYYCTRPNFNKFGKGWKNRIKTLALACGFDIKL